MKREELIYRLVQAIAEHEGFFVTEDQAKARKIKFPTLAQRNANPGNIRSWKDAAGRQYPQSMGYVDFVTWASGRFPGASPEELRRRAVEEGWRILRVLVGQYLDGKYTGHPPTLYEMFGKYAPASDSNDPQNYARVVAGKVGIRPDVPLSEVIA